MNESDFPPAGEGAGRPLPSQTNPPHRVLVADDDLSIREIHLDLLTRSGYAVDVAADGAVAWQALNADTYDLLITDNDMPELSGFELLHKLRAANLTLPVIMVTGKPPAEEFTRHPWPQPTAMLFKPHTVAELIRIVKKVLREANGPEGGATPSAPEPRASTEPPAPPATTKAGPARSAPHILVVEGDRELGRLYASALSGPGYQVDLREDGAAAWEALQTNHYNLLIIERDLPDLNGIELVSKARSARMALPVVLTAATWPEDQLAQQPALQLAATLPKPFGVVTLLATVRNVLHTTHQASSPGRRAN